MPKSTLGLPAGYRDLVFDEARNRRRIDQRLAQLLEETGYGEILPSAVEYLELYRRGNQSSAEHAVKFFDRNDDILALRADFTPSVARIVARRLSGAPLPVRVWYSGNVFRKADSRGGRWSEFGQIGAECIGSNGIEIDAEVIALSLRLLDELGIHDAECHVNHAGVFRGIVDELALNPEELDRVKAEIDHKDARGLAARLESFGVATHLREQLRVLSRCVGGAEVLHDAQKHLRNGTSLAAIGWLETLLLRSGSLRDRITVDMTEIDDMEYYTGIIFTIFSPRLNEALGTGGRYDSLFQEFGAPMPAIGFSLSMDGLMEITP
jgi:ATP phosphoribosyltransferase regulatory subunit